MLTPLLLTLTLLHQAPASSEPPLPIFVAPLSTSGVPSHLVAYCREHLYDQLDARGARAIRPSALDERVAARRRRALLRCKRKDEACVKALGKAAGSEAVLYAEVRSVRGYLVTLRVHSAETGAVLAEHSLKIPKRSDQLVETLTRALDVTMPKVLEQLRPPPTEPTEPLEPSAPTGPAQPETTVAEQGASGAQGTPPVPEPSVPPEPQLVQVPTAAQDPLAARSPLGGVPGTPARPSLTRPGWAWVPAAAGLLAAGGGTYLWLEAGRSERLLRDETQPPPANGSAVKRAGVQAYSWGRGLVVAGGTAMVASGLLYLLLPGEHPPLRPTATLTPNGGAVGVAGTLP